MNDADSRFCKLAMGLRSISTDTPAFDRGRSMRVRIPRSDYEPGEPDRWRHYLSKAMGHLATV